MIENLYKRKLVLCFFFIIITILFSLPTFATVVGVNRAQLYFNDVLRDGYAQENFIVSIGTDFDVEFFFDVRGEISDWVRLEFNRNDSLVNKDNPLVVTVIVEPPFDARVDDYEGSILVLTGPLSGEKGRMGTDVVAAFEVKLHLNLTDTQILDCNVGGLHISSEELGMPLLFEGSATNRGNVRINPEIIFEVFNQDESILIINDSYLHQDSILPTSTGKLESSLKWDLDPGQYWARISDSVCTGGNYVTFNVLERGAIQDEIDFVRIENEPWAKVGEIVPITVKFRNTGVRVVSAQFKGAISKEGKILEIIESELIDLSPGEYVELDIYYNPPEDGQYSVKGRINYNNKISFEKGSIINVESATNVKTYDVMNVLFFLLLIIVLVLIFLIARKKKKQKRRVNYRR